MTNSPMTERYVAGRMSDTEISEFEAQMLDHPELAADVDVRQRIKAGLELLEERGELPDISTNERAGRWHRPFGLAAGIAVLAISATFLFWYRNESRGSFLVASSEVTRTASIPSIMLAATRGNELPQSIPVPPGVQFIELRALIEGHETALYDARLQQSRGGELKTLGRFEYKTGSDGMLAVWIRVNELDSGEYQLSISEKGLPQSEQRFTFALTRLP